jgi:hypothetical protein
MSEDKVMPRKFITVGFVQEAPFQPKKLMFMRYVYVDIDGTLYTKPSYPPPPLKKEP